MPKGVKLTDAIIQQRMIEWRNLKRMYGRAKARVEQLLDENKQLKKKADELESERDDLREKLKAKEDTKNSKKFKG